ncbi:MAG: ROK family protein [Thomasclavelia sp.]
MEMKRIGTGKLREQNDRIVLSFLSKGQAVTKRELANETGLTFATIGNILNEFKNQNIVKVKETVISKKGRPTITYILNPEYFYSLNIVIMKKDNQNYLYYQICNALLDVIVDDHEIIDLTKIEDLLKKIVTLVKQETKIKIIGVGVPAVIFEDVIVEADIAELKDLNLKKLIETATGINTVVKNEMNYCAYGFYQSLTEKKDVCYLVFPSHSGPGCGSVINGKLLQGDHNIAGEIIYLPFFEFLKHHDPGLIKYDENNVAYALCSLASIINPAYLVITGDGLHNVDLDLMQQVCLQYIPKQFLAKIIYKDSYIDDFFNGMKKYVSNYYLY